MDPKSLVFFVTTDPRTDPGPARLAYHFAAVAARAGLEAEVRLAGDAVKVALLVDGAEDSALVELQDKVRAGASGQYRVSLCPVSVGTRGVSEEQVARIGGRPRPLADILTEVADGRSTLIYVS